MSTAGSQRRSERRTAARGGSGYILDRTLAASEDWGSGVTVSTAAAISLSLLEISISRIHSRQMATSRAISTGPMNRPRKPIVFTPPRASDYRVVLENGMVVYIVEDATLPLVNMSFTIRTGSYLEPAGKEGLAALTGSQIRRGGTRTLTAEQLDEKLDFLAANVSTGIGATSGSASLNAVERVRATRSTSSRRRPSPRISNVSVMAAIIEGE